jgi:hypothetical protein
MGSGPGRLAVNRSRQGPSLRTAPRHRSVRAQLAHTALTLHHGGRWLFLTAACRTRSIALGTLSSRHCVRSMFCWSMFCLVRPLPSAASAADGCGLFDSFVGTMGLPARSDFSARSRAERPAWAASASKWTEQASRSDSCGAAGGTCSDHRAHALLANTSAARCGS